MWMGLICGHSPNFSSPSSNCHGCVCERERERERECVCVCECVCVDVSDLQLNIRWFWSVGSIKSKVSFAKEPYKTDDILQKRPVILSIPLTAATPYANFSSLSSAWCVRVCVCIQTHTHPHASTMCTTQGASRVHIFVWSTHIQPNVYTVGWFRSVGSIKF